MRAALLAAAALLGCGGSSAAPPQSGKSGPSGKDDTSKAVNVARDAPVPSARDPRERLVYLRAGSVWMMKPDGDEPTQLTVRTPSAPDQGPALSPAGDAIAYASPEEGVYRIFVMSLDELIPRAITDGSDGGDSEPAWSPDGERIAFMRGDPRVKRDLYLVELPDGTPRRLVEGNDDAPEAAGAPVWQPDGSAILFSADRRDGNGTLLWRYHLEGGTLDPVTPAKHMAWYVVDRNAAFSPDGSRIAFDSNRHAPSGDQRKDRDVYSVAPDGSGLTRLTSDPASAENPCYSPDGTRIFFSSTRERENSWESEIYVMAAGGGKQRRVTREERPQNRAPFAGLAQ